jgi:hypothetical protein
LYEKKEALCAEIKGNLLLSFSRELLRNQQPGNQQKQSQERGN